MQRFLVASVLCVALVADRTSADEASNPQEARIRKALDEKTAVEFIETPLHDVTVYLAKKHSIEIQIDKRALDDAGLGTDTPVTRMVKDISLRSLLRLMLKEFDLTFVIDNEVLMLTTVDEAGQRLHTQIYDVEDLVVTDAGVDYDSLVSMILATIAPTTWDEVGGPGSISTLHRTLIISQTEEVHEQIESLLASVARVLEARKDKAPANPAAILPGDPKAGIVRTYRVNVPDRKIGSVARHANPRGEARDARVQAATLRARHRCCATGQRPLRGGTGPRIPSLVKPETWERGGGTGVIYALPTDASGAGQLLVRQSADVHRRLQTFLMSLQMRTGGEFVGPDFELPHGR